MHISVGRHPAALTTLIGRPAAIFSRSTADRLLLLCWDVALACGGPDSEAGSLRMRGGSRHRISVPSSRVRMSSTREVSLFRNLDDHSKGSDRRKSLAVLSATWLKASYGYQAHSCLHRVTRWIGGRTTSSLFRSRRGEPFGCTTHGWAIGTDRLGGDAIGHRTSPGNHQCRHGNMRPVHRRNVDQLGLAAFG